MSIDGDFEGQKTLLCVNWIRILLSDMETIPYFGSTRLQEIKILIEALTSEKTLKITA